MIKLNPKTTKLEVGMKVMLRSDLKGGDYGCQIYCSYNPERMMQGEIVTIKTIEGRWNNEAYFTIVEDTCPHWNGYHTAMIDYIIGEGMTKDDLKTKMGVKTREGSRYIVLDDIIVRNSDAKGFNLIDNYQDDLTSARFPMLDIMEIYQPRNCGTMLKCEFESSAWKLIWQRTEPKEVTMSEVNARFGYDVKIVEG